MKSRETITRENGIKPMLRSSFFIPQKLLLLTATILIQTTCTSASSNINIVIAGSANLDTFLPIQRLPEPGENLTLLPHKHPILDIPGGKGCNQAIACSKLLSSSSESNVNNCKFVCRLGDDEGASIFQNVLLEHHVDTTHVKSCKGLGTGRGYVFLEGETGRVSAVVSGGSNMYGWDDFKQEPSLQAEMNLKVEEIFKDEESNTGGGKLEPTKCLLLQREIPEFVNLALAQYAQSRGIVVLQDVGGEDRTMTEEMMASCDFLMPNLTELERLVGSLTKDASCNLPKLDPKDNECIIQYAKFLQKNGAKNVLVTMGERGSILVQKNGNSIHQKIFPLKTGIKVVDETGAGDCYRAAFAVALMERGVGVKSVSASDQDVMDSMKECMEFASVAGALAVTKEGAVPSIPSRKEVDEFLKASRATSKSASSPIKCIPRGGTRNAKNEYCLSNDDSDTSIPYMFGSRLNSMKDRPDLWPESVDNVQEWVKRQGTIDGLGCVDFNYPQHFHSWSPMEAKEALGKVGLKAGAVCLRYPGKFARGAMNHPEEHLRREAIEMTKKAAEVARILGCDEVVVWSAYDGYDYSFQVDYNEKWNQLVEAFQECCDAYPDIKWSLEFKPTDENTRFFTVPSTGAALLLVKEINRPNMGLTLDVGHMLMAGENPGQSIAMVGDKLFGIQLNDGYTRLAAEDGMMFGSVHPIMALEIMYQLQENNFGGHLYFDTFPQRTDPVKEAEYNIQSATRFWTAAKLLDREGMKDIMDEHDAVGALKAINDVLKSV